ncbi:aldolase/citrate lyase family protein [Pseudonocardia eucalypti]|uniref:Aldolase/citrate lyase family protein n=1 Tax=Pseudonocardia eucalypti TaxID=648755 RepID=A0ABP9PY06_9PSEU|nr:4-hydroxy-2-oxoheptanedioate aldolase [Pseudonocardia eucalypti]
MTGNKLRRKWRERTVFGVWSTIPSTAAVEVLVECGYDFVAFDCQHGQFGVADLEPLLRVTARTEVTPAVRVPGNDYYAIGHALDAGAEVLIVPMVETAEQAARAAFATRYPPEGGRSFARNRGMAALGATPAELNREVACLVMVETATGLANAAEIAATPGVDGVFVGPADLGLALGLPPGPPPFAAEVERGIDQVVSACRSAGVIAGLHANGGYAARGVDLVTVAADHDLLRVAGRNTIAQARGTTSR